LILREQETFLSLITSSENVIVQIANHFLVSFILLIFPTTLMGMTFPIVALSMKKRINNTLLYAANNGGAAVGSIITGFFLIKILGIPNALFSIFLLSLFVFLSSFLLQFLQERERTVPIVNPDKNDFSRVTSKKFSIKNLHILAFLSGFIFLSYEMLWQRIFSLLFGNRIYVSSVILFFIFVGMTYGAILNKKWLRQYSPERMITFCYSIGVAITSLLLLVYPFLFDTITHTGPDILKVLFCEFICLIPATCLGMVFPLTLSLEPNGSVKDTEKGKYIGSLYAVNTLACLLGALVTTYILVKFMGTFHTFFIIGLVSFLPVALVNKVKLKQKSALFVFTAFIINLMVILSQGIQKEPKEVIVREEDEYGLFKVVRLDEELFNVFNNCTALVFTYGAPQTQYVQEMQAHLPALFSENPEKVLNIGTGYGITAGAFTRYHEINRIETIEILPLMVKYSDIFKKFNYAYYNNSKVIVSITDGRQYLAKTEEKYDIISINVSDPYLPSSSSLFSTEFYQIVKSRLNKGGIVCQHLFGFDNVSLVHQFKAHFPYIKAIPAYKNGINVIGSLTPLPSEPLFRDIDPGYIDIDRDQIIKWLNRGEKMLETYLSEDPRFVQRDIKPVLEYRVIQGKLGVFFSNN